MHILTRLRDELKVNSTCGASNVSFGLPNRNGLNAAFLNNGNWSRNDFSHNQPIACRGDAGAVMGADVMMGHDPDCIRWIARFREAPAHGQVSARDSRRGIRRRARNG